MKIIAFFLTLIVYAFITLFFYSIFSVHPKKERIVFVHTAIIVKNNPFKKNNHKTLNNTQNKTNTEISKSSKKIYKKENKKIGSKTAFTKGGSVNFNDIFRNVKYNVPTKKVNLKKQSGMSRLRGEILKKLNKIKSLNFDITFKTSSNVSKAKVNELVNKMYEIWNNISFIPGEYAIIKFVNNNGNVQVIILDSNLNLDKQKELIDEIEKINFNKNIDITVKFQTKVNK